MRGMAFYGYWKAAANKAFESLTVDAPVTHRGGGGRGDAETDD
jgi:hypothetical protein